MSVLYQASSHQHTHTTKVMDGMVSLGRSHIQEGGLTVNGGQPPAGMVIDLAGGMVSWEDQQNLGDPGPYEFAYTYTQYDPPSDENLVAIMGADLDAIELQLAAAATVPQLVAVNAQLLDLLKNIKGYLAEE